MEKLRETYGDGLTPEQVATMRPPIKMGWELELTVIESAGLLVLDPADEALVERIAGAIRLAAQAGLIQSDSLAHAVLAALAGNEPGGKT